MKYIIYLRGIKVGNEIRKNEQGQKELVGNKLFGRLQKKKKQK